MMRLLTIDEQTIADLGIFGKPGKASVYELFNKTVTQGGSARLAMLFREPLADADAINSRVALYRVFSEDEYSFPVDAVTVGSVVFYYSNEDVRSQLTLGGEGIGLRMKQLVAADADHAFVKDGVQAVIRLWQQVNEFVRVLGSRISGTAYETAHRELSVLLEDEPFQRLAMYRGRKEVRLNDVALSELDKAFRFEYREALGALLDRLYDLDVYISIGQVARRRGFHFAKALPADAGLLEYRQVYHPHVEGAIANDLKMDPGQNILFLTGANMAGKSTLMKSVGVALYLAHMGFPVAAVGLEFAVKDGIYTSINLADNLQAGASHYYAEVLRVKEVARELAAGKRLLVIFDELFRGTNVKDAYDATIALTRAFARKRQSQFIISTHIMEAGEVLQKEGLSIKYQYLPTRVRGTVPEYTRVLENGITADRQGMMIIRNEGIIDILDKGIARQSGRP